MDRGLVNLGELRKRFANGEYDFIGNRAYCFVIDDKIVKIYGTKEDNYDFIYVDRSKVCDFSKFMSKIIVFPDEYIPENGIKAAELSTFITVSKPIIESFRKLVYISRMMDSYPQAINELNKFDNINMPDLGSTNILYSNEKGFNIIDPTLWFRKNNSSKENIDRFNLALIDTIIDVCEIPIRHSKFYNNIDSNFYNNLNKFGRPGECLQNVLKGIINHEYDFLWMIYSIVDIYYKYYGTDLKTIQDIKEITKVLKKG